MTISKPFLLAASTLTLTALAYLGIVACCSPSPKGRPVAFGDQTNIIIWNPDTKVEHFVRKALFKSEATDFGFIAPTPSKPELSAADEKAFDLLAELTPHPPVMGCAKGVPGSESKSDPGVEVVQEKDVAGYHATTLLASNAQALAAWLKKNGYQSTHGIEKWTQFYIQKGWYLTAFKVKNPTEVASTGTVQLSFPAAVPFNPYYVPDDNISSKTNGNLQVFFVSKGQYNALLGGSKPWLEPTWHENLPADMAETLAGYLKIPVSAIPVDARVEYFLDPEFPRHAADDIYFYFSPNRSIDWFSYLFVAALLGVAWIRIRAMRAKAVRPRAGV